MKIHLGYIFFMTFLFGFVEVSHAWDVEQTTIKHVQVGGAFYMSITGDTTVSGCANHPGWLRMDLTNAGVKEKALMSFAMT